MAVVCYALPVLLTPQSSNLKILDPDGKTNPVVNERGSLQLTVVDANGQTVADAAFESGSPDIATVDPKTGMVKGVERGFSTVTARRGGESVSVFVAVTRVSGGKGPKAPGEMTQDTGSRIYFSDPIGSVIQRKDAFEADPKIFAGVKDRAGRMDGKRTDALFAGPTAVTADNRAQGGIFITDTLNHSIRKIDFNDNVTTLLGTGSPGITQALLSNDSVKFDNPQDISFNGPRGIAANAAGNLFIADTDNHAIYFADLTKNEVQLIAGQPGMSGKIDGKGRAARFTRPTGIALSKDGKAIAVADAGNNRVRLIDLAKGEVTTIGSGAGSAGIISTSLSTIDQVEKEIEFIEPQSVSFDGARNLYVVDRSKAQALVVTGALDNKAQVVSLAQAGSFGEAVSIVVRGTQTFVLDNNAASEAEAVKAVTVGEPQITSLNFESSRLEGGAEIIITGKNFAPESLVVLGESAAKDAVVVSATEIRLTVPRQTVPGNRTLSVQTRGGAAQRAFGITAKPFEELADGEITTVAGGIPFLGDGGKATEAGLFFPNNVVIDGSGNLIFTDPVNARIRRVDSEAGIITTIAGNGTRGFSGDGGPAVSARLSLPRGVAIDGSGNLIIADTGNNRIRRVDAVTGIITTIVGNGEASFNGDGGQAAAARLNGPASASIDDAGNLFIVDAGNSRIRRVDAKTGVISTVAGNGKFEFSGDGNLAVNAGLNLGSQDFFGFIPGGDIAIDRDGNLFIADCSNHRIRRVDAVTGIITTIAGNGKASFSGDGGQAVNAGLKPGEVAVDRAGNLFIVDAGNNRVRRVDAKTGVISTVAGNGDNDFDEDDGPATKISLGNLDAIALDGAGNLYISTFNRIRRVDAKTGIITTVAGNAKFNYSGDGGQAVDASLRSPDGIAIDEAGNLFIADTSNNAVRVVKGVAEGRGEQNQVTITNASFSKPNLIISGNGFGSTGAMVIVNGRDVGSLIISQADSAIVLKGNKKKLNLKKGQNQIAVTANGITSNLFVLNL